MTGGLLDVNEGMGYMGWIGLCGYVCSWMHMICDMIDRYVDNTAQYTEWILGDAWKCMMWHGVLYVPGVGNVRISIVTMCDCAS